MTLPGSAAKSDCDGAPDSAATATAKRMFRRNDFACMACPIRARDSLLAQARIHVHVLPGVNEDRMIAIALELRIDEHVAVARDARLPGAVDLHLPAHQQEQMVPLGRIEIGRASCR